MPGLAHGFGFGVTFGSVLGPPPTPIPTPFDVVRDILQANNGSLLLPAPGYVFSDTAGLVPATVGGKVALITCAVSSGKTAVQATSANQAVLRVDGSGTHYLDPNGANCFYVSDCSGSGVKNFTMIGHGATSGSGKVFAGCYKLPNDRAFFGARSTSSDGKIGAAMNTVSWNTLFAEQFWAAERVVSVTRNTTQAKLYVSGVLQDTETLSGFGTALPIYMMAVNNDGVAEDFWSGSWFGYATALATLSDIDRETVEEYMLHGGQGLPTIPPGAWLYDDPLQSSQLLTSGVL